MYSSVSDSRASPEVERATRESIGKSKGKVGVRRPYGTTQRPMYCECFTAVRGLVTAVYTTAEDLGLDEGKQLYVAAVVCACTIEAANTEDEDKKEALASKVLQQPGSYVCSVLHLYFMPRKTAPTKLSSLDYISGIAMPALNDAAFIMDERLKG